MFEALCAIPDMPPVRHLVESTLVAESSLHCGDLVAELKWDRTVSSSVSQLRIGRSASRISTDAEADPQQPAAATYTPGRGLRTTGSGTKGTPHGH